MKRHVAALVAVLFLASATPSEGPDRAASLASGPSLRGVPLGLQRERTHAPLPVAAPAVRVVPNVSVPAPTPTGEVGTAIYSASMTWCGPTPTQCQGWGGTAQLAAVNSFRWGDARYWVRIWRGQDFADALVVSHCACNGELGYIDVSPHVFRQLAPLSRGRVDVAVEVLTWPGDSEDPPPHPSDELGRVEDGGPAVTAPPTDWSN